MSDPIHPAKQAAEAFVGLTQRILDLQTRYDQMREAIQGLQGNLRAIETELSEARDEFESKVNVIQSYAPAVRWRNG